MEILCNFSKIPFTKKMRQSHSSSIYFSEQLNMEEKYRD